VGQAINVRCVDFASVATEIGVTEVVDKDHDNVRRSLW
jgi:hypothetical protein